MCREIDGANSSTIPLTVSELRADFTTVIGFRTPQSAKGVSQAKSDVDGQIAHRWVALPCWFWPER